MDYYSSYSVECSGFLRRRLFDEMSSVSKEYAVSTCGINFLPTTQDVTSQRTTLYLCFGPSSGLVPLNAKAKFSLSFYIDSKCIFSMCTYIDRYSRINICSTKSRQNQYFYFFYLFRRDFYTCPWNILLQNVFFKNTQSFIPPTDIDDS